MQGILARVLIALTQGNDVEANETPKPHAHTTSDGNTRFWLRLVQPPYEPFH